VARGADRGRVSATDRGGARAATSSLPTTTSVRCKRSCPKAHRGGLSPAFIAVMLKKKPDEPLLASDIDRKRESFAMPPSAQAYGSPSLEEILGDEPVENRRATVFAREGTEREGNTSGGTEPLGRYRRAVALPAMDKRANPVEVAANSVTVPIPIYAVPPGYQSSGDGTNMYLRDSNGNLVKNPLLQKRIDNFRFKQMRNCRGSR